MDVCRHPGGGRSYGRSWSASRSISVTVVFGTERLTGNSDEIWVSNPFYVPAVDAALGWFGDFWLMFLVLFAGSVVSLAVRFHGAQGVERQQIKWVAFSMLVLLATFFVSEFLLVPNDAVLLDAIITGGAFLLLPLAIGVAVLRYRLYDLDVVVRKAVVYALLALFATLVYLAIVLGVGAWLGRDSSFLTMLAAVIVAVTFQPVRARVARFANRLVYGKRASPYEVLAEFSERVGGAYADEDVLPRMARVLGEGVGAERADVWLAVDRELRDVRGVARRWRRSSADAASERVGAADRWHGPRVPGRAVRRAAGRARGPQAGERSRLRPPTRSWSPTSPVRRGWCSATSA